MAARIITLTHLIPSVSPWNVWDLPLWMWRGYAEFVDQYEREAKEANR